MDRLLDDSFIILESLASPGDQLRINKSPSTADGDQRRPMMCTGDDLHVHHWPTVVNDFEVNSQGYWFESNRGSKAPGQRLVVASRSEPIFAGVARNP
jgi:hypothetical protein